MGTNAPPAIGFVPQVTIFLPPKMCRFLFSYLHAKRKKRGELKKYSKWWFDHSFECLMNGVSTASCDPRPAIVLLLKKKYHCQGHELQTKRFFNFLLFRGAKITKFIPENTPECISENLKIKNFYSTANSQTCAQGTWMHLYRPRSCFPI